MKLNDNVKTGVQTRSGFDLSFDGVLSQNWGDIVPIVCKEMVPGDSFTCDASAFVRLAPLATPTYGRIHGYINYFFVPNRILCVDRLWEDFIRGGSTGKIDYTLPYTTTQLLYNTIRSLDAGPQRSARKLCTYLGLPDPLNYGVYGDPASHFHLSILPFAAYNRIYGDYFYPWGIDENGDASAENLYFRRYSGNMITLSADLLQTHRACFKKDYMTTAQINPQRGGTAFVGQTGSPGSSFVQPDNVDIADGGNSTIPILSVKWATAVQKFLERNNVAGARYFEQILARFGIAIPAERLDRSEYLGGSDFYIGISDVTSSASTDTASLGDMAGKGVGLGQGGVSYNAKDYGFFIATLHLMPESGVVQGLNRMWTRSARTDYFTPEFEENGMQPIYNCELWSDLYFDTHSQSNQYRVPADTGVYGYIPRYAEYKFSAPVLAGDFRFKLSGDESLVSFSDMDSMHLYRVFTNSDGNYPVLSPEFVTLTDDGAFNRIFQDTNNDFDHFWTNIQVKLGANRPMQGYLEAATSFINDDKSGRVNIPAFGLRL